MQFVFLEMSNERQFSEQTSAWDKFLLLTWKNWVIQIRHPVQTTFEVLVPIFVCALMVFIRCQAEVTVFKNDIRYTPIRVDSIDPILQILSENLGNDFILHSPNNSVLNDLMRKVAFELQFNVELSVPKENASVLEDSANNLKPFASIEFDDSLKVVLGISL
jgi:ATP-binding cassette, subfamily A (ABC1), member 3